MIWTPRVTVAAVIEQRRRFLLVEERIDGRVVLNQPAGHLEQDESLLEAVVRETAEETARRFTPDALTGVYHWTVPGSGPTYLRFAFSGRVDEAAANRPLDDGILGSCWLTRDQAAASGRLRSPLVLRCIDDHLAGACHPLSLLHDLDRHDPLR